MGHMVLSDEEGRRELISSDESSWPIGGDSGCEISVLGEEK